MWHKKRHYGSRYSNFRKEDDASGLIALGIFSLGLMGGGKVIELYKTDPTKFMIGLFVLLGLIAWIGIYIYNKRNKRSEVKPGNQISNNINRNQYHNESSNIQKETRGTICQTLKGEVVKSLSEKHIADYLYKQGIKYTYEKPYVLTNGTMINPDFYLDEYNIYIEYFGLLGNPKYNHTIALKKNTYKNENMKVIELYPNNLWNENQYNESKLDYILRKRFEEISKNTESLVSA